MRPFVLASVIAATAASAAQSQTATWVGPTVGNWNVNGSWNPIGVPGNGAAAINAIISTSRGSAVTLDVNLSPLNLITIGAGNSVKLPDNRALFLNSLTNNGTFSMASGGNATDFRVNADAFALSGTGTLAMGNHINNRIYGATALRTLTQSSDHTIRGSGQLGANTFLNLVNGGLIQADQATALQIDLSPGANQNFGTMLATNGATLNILNTPLDNTGGIIRANDASAVSITNSQIVEGTLTTLGSGVVQVLGSSSSLDSVHNTGLLFVPDNNNVTLYDSLINDATVSLASGGNATDIRIDSPTLTIGGNGTVALGNHINNRIYGANSLRTLDLASTQTIRGSGQVGFNTFLNLINHGLIQADQSTQLQIDLSPGANQNLGTMLATNGATLHLLATELDNTSGIIRADNASVVNITNSQIAGGTFETAGTGVVQILGSSGSLDDVHNTGALLLPDNRTVFVYDSLTNDATFSLASGGNATDVVLGTDIWSLEGTGTVALGNHINNRIYGSGSLRTLDLASTQTIRGSGQIGVNAFLNLINHGLIQADQSTQLQIDLSPGANQNLGTMLATNGATLHLLATELDNTSGVIRADNASVVNITNSQIAGGTFETAGTGVVQILGSSGSLDDVHNTGALLLPDNRTVFVYDSLTNDATFSLASGGNATDVVLGTDIWSLEGTGTVALGNHINNRIYGSGSLRTLDLASTQTIRGSGQIGANAFLNLINHGLIQADQSTQLQIDLSPGANKNLATMVATNGATLRLLGTALDNTGGTIRAETGSVVNIESSQVSGGTFTTTGSGVLQLLSSSALDAVHNTGAMNLPDNQSVFVNNSLTNDGTFSLSSGGNATNIILNTDTWNLNGTGTVAMGNHVNNRIYGAGALRTLVLGASETIKGAGQIGLNTLLNLTNQGTINADQPSGMTIDCSTSFVSTGTLKVTGAGALTVGAPGLLNGGLVQIDAGRQMTHVGSMNQIGGATLVNGTLSLNSGGTLVVGGGALEGSGLVNAPISNNAGTVAPGTSPNGIATLSENGTFVQAINGTYAVDLGLAGNDMLAITGAATLNGILRVAFVPGFVPAIGQEFTILTATSVTGTFSCVQAPSLSGMAIHPVYTATTVKLVVDGTGALLGDLNGDGHVTGADLALLLGQWGPGGCGVGGCCTADLDGDGIVTGADLAILLGAWTG